MRIIPRCYDSHIHLAATGEVASGLKLHFMKSQRDLSRIKHERSHFRGEWLTGFGWDDSTWQVDDKPQLKTLDESFNQFPVYFVRIDGHVAWVNTLALKRLGVSPIGHSGFLYDQEKAELERILPPYSEGQQKQFLVDALRLFNRNGFTHLRDMTSSETQFHILRNLEGSKELTAFLELWFLCEKLSDLPDLIRFCKKASMESSHQIRISGIKIFFDGALGSEGALLSQNYLNSKKNGFSLWTRSEFEMICRKTWESGLSLSIHVIGDEATHLVAHYLADLSSRRISGPVHLEHIELARPESLALFRYFKPICHMQPCHWLSDRQWLDQKLGRLSQYAFPWRAIDELSLDLFFGSDSPIESPSLEGTKKALELSAAEGIPALNTPWEFHHSHPDLTWGSQCVTQVEDLGKILTWFEGRLLSE